MITDKQVHQLSVLIDAIARVDEGTRTDCIDWAIDSLQNIKHIRENLPF